MAMTTSWSRLALQYLSQQIYHDGAHAYFYSIAGGAFMVVLVTLAALLLSFLFPKRSTHFASFPRGPPSWPILGHLPLFHAGLPHQTLAAFSLCHGFGPIIGLRLGSVPAVVISGMSLAKEVLLTQDKAFANRPRYTFADNLVYGYDTAVIWSSYGPHWSRLRKICTLELFTPKRLHDLQYVREEEMAGLIHRIVQASNGGMEAIDVGRCVGKMTSNMISRLLQSKTLSEASYSAMGGDSLSELVKKQEHEAAPTIGDFFPSLRCLDVLRKRRMRCIHARLNKVLDTIVAERRLAMRTTPHNELPHDFLQVLLSREALNTEGLQNEVAEGEILTTREIKAILLDLLDAGTHTTALTVEWGMAELLRSPSSLRKLRNEIDTVLGAGQLVRDEDISKLPYLQNVVKEIFRLHPVVPLLLPRIVVESCKVGKYTLPPGTQVFVNVWAIGRDSHVWQEAERFWPERFEGMDIDLRGQHYELLPFGSGRRMCPGLRLGLSIVQVILANLVKSLDWELPHGQTHMSIDMSEKRGMTNNKAMPVLAIPKLRQALL